MGKCPTHEEDQDPWGGRFQPQHWASRSHRQETCTALMLHACEPAGWIAYPALSWQLPHSRPAWPSIACDLKSLSSHAGGGPDPATYALLRRKYPQVLLRAGSVATSHCWFCTALGLVTAGASLRTDMWLGGWGLSCAIGLLGAGQGHFSPRRWGWGYKSSCTNPAPGGNAQRSHQLHVSEVHPSSLPSFSSRPRISALYPRAEGTAPAPQAVFANREFSECGAMLSEDPRT